MLRKLGFHPESFARTSLTRDVTFSHDFQHQPLGEHLKTTASSPLL